MIRNKCKTIGLTGGIASGKTSVKNILLSKGYRVIDADLIARQVVEKYKPSYYEVIKYFGDQVLDENKNIDRLKLAHIIFNDSKKRKELESILYPYIFAEILRQIMDLCKDKPQVIFIDIPLLFENIRSIEESGISFEEIWLVYCDMKTQIQRLTTRDNISKEKALLRINAQMDIEEKRKLADVVIENTSSKEFLLEQIDSYVSALEQEKV